jgi:hypothetical protein
VGKLKLKAILHHGEAAFNKVRQFVKIGGEDVILAHRLLKNSVPGHEYVLLSQAFADIADGFQGKELEALERSVPHVHRQCRASTDQQATDEKF